MVVKAKLHQKSIDDVINKGADVIEDRKEEGVKEWTMISVRLPKAMLQKMDEIRKEKDVGLTRNAWIIQQFQTIMCLWETRATERRQEKNFE